MKRSEMIKEMEKAWNKYIHSVTPDYNGTWYGMEYVLTRMEELGILPPINTTSYPSYSSDCPEGYFDNEWDNEAEDFDYRLFKK